MKDMTTGHPLKQILAFMIPVLLGNWFQNFYNIADIMIVGRFLGVDALAAVGSTGSIVFLVVGWIVGLTSGFGILLAQAFGARDEKRLKHYTAMSCFLCFVFAVLMTIGLLIANEEILRLLNTPQDIFEDTSLYISIIYVGLPATILYNLVASIARALGDSKTPLYFLALSSVINIGLDFLFVGVLPFGVAGAAYATVISQMVSGVLCLIYVYKKYPSVRFSNAERKLRKTTIISLLAMGIPMALQFSITAIGTMITQSALNQLGAVYIATYAGSMKIQGIIIQVYAALGAAMANYVGQNFGAGKLERIKKGLKSAVAFVGIYSILASLFGYFICPNLIVLFAEDPTGELVELSKQIFHIAIWFYFPLGLIFVYRNALQGLGNGVVPMLGGVAELIARAIVIFFLFEPLQFLGICLTDPFGCILALIPLIPFYYRYMSRLSKKFA